jgi:hypothetical protein
MSYGRNPHVGHDAKNGIGLMGVPAGDFGKDAGVFIPE